MYSQTSLITNYFSFQINAVIFYSVTIFEAAGSNIDPNVSSIIIGSIQVFCVGISTVLMDRAGRKMLLIISDTGMAISLAALGVFFYLKDEKNGGEVPEGLGWLPLASLIFYMITYNVALGPVPWLMMGELLPTRVKGMGINIEL
jgi:MFS family permease